MKLKDIIIIALLLVCAVSLYLIALGNRYKQMYMIYYFDTWTGNQVEAKHSAPQDLFDKLPNK